jgi:hypothetical protein
MSIKIALARKSRQKFFPKQKYQFKNEIYFASDDSFGIVLPKQIKNLLRLSFPI